MNEIKFCGSTPTVMKGHTAVIEGAKCKDSSTFLQTIWTKLKFPDASHINWDAYLDWMRDLEWIEEKDITIIIEGYADFLSDEPGKKNGFLSDFIDIVFPYWENNALEVLGSEDGIKNITVICVMEQIGDTGIIPTKDVVKILDRDALNGQKTAHSISVPVIRTENGRLVLSVFLFFYNKEQLQSAMVRRPSMWLVADFVSGEIITRYSCQEKDFSTSSHDKLYNISANDLPVLPEGYWKSVYEMLDVIRSEYVKSGRLNVEGYNQYLQKILDSTPTEYRTFYEELSYIEEKEEDLLEEKVNTPTDEIAQPVVTEASVENAVLIEKLDAVSQALVALQESFDDKIAVDAHKNGLFDNMHRELIGYRNGVVDKLIDSIALDIIQLIDITKSNTRVYEEKEPTEENYKKLLKAFKGVVQDLEDVLYRQSIEPYCVSGQEVDVRRQKIIQIVPTDDESKDNLVAERTADGYEKGDKVIRPERIKIFKYKNKPKTPQEN